MDSNVTASMHPIPTTRVTHYYLGRPNSSYFNRYGRRPRRGSRPRV